VRESVDIDDWRGALLRDMAYEARQTPGHCLTSIFFGGGTPSLMPPALVADLIDAAGQHWGFAPDIEITLEANPNSVEVARFADLARAGVNRVSLGIQSFEQDMLRFLGRAHDADEARTALDTAQANFTRASFDLIYALPGQTLEQWEAQLSHALSLGTGHLSLYQLTIEPGTRFETMVRRGEFVPLDADQAADFYEATRKLTMSLGIPAYEISNHARTGEESRHNLAYWRYRDYVGIGPGAHGRRGGMATQRHKKPENWLRAVAQDGHGAESETRLDARDQAREALMMGLRLTEGLDISALAARLTLHEDEMLDRQAVARLAGYGLLRAEGSAIAVSPQGMLLLDAILPQIVI
jgi:putative oxygen-independent coproporphyrinogen III oxidase